MSIIIKIEEFNSEENLYKRKSKYIKSKDVEFEIYNYYEKN